MSPFKKQLFEYSICTICILIVVDEQIFLRIIVSKYITLDKY
jgi:hypothetical protein